jgi:hypothetical protein
MFVWNGGNVSDKKIVMRESDEAAKLVTVTGWSSADGRFFGKDERTARYAGSTHQLCECGTVIDKSRTKCDKCHHKARWEKYKSLQSKDWNGGDFLVTWDDDKFFWCDSDLMDYCEEQQMQPQDMQLVFAKPVYGRYLDGSYFCDELHEDGELPDSILEAMESFNAVVKAAGPLSWIPGNIAAIIPEHYRLQYNAATIQTAQANIDQA